MTQILLAEDDLDFGSILQQYLQLHSFQVTWAKNGVEAFEIFQKNNFEICVLDVMMPKLDGFSLAEKIIVLQPETPFVFLTARNQKEDKIKGLRLGADDYIVKPFEVDELILRLQNILKRSQKTTIKQQQIIIEIGSYNFDTQTLLLMHKKKTQRVTEKESLLLQFLYKNKNQLVKREEILKAVWGNDDFFSGRSMDVFISRLRKYFIEDPSIKIESIRGVGLEFKTIH
ncbi:DNA-binding response OmpR family regulator [Tenacibaculum lutimaris]|uniref:DNA-binding response OmpR family regulator n=1 Tax=Tenacibaculum lutimaris TaxID=285258 RepID=A0A420E2S5_9FLAO|nr:response regulator transcription factor [Tenacibaculum lutimaris]RKF04350.1 DNA-binding response OmpR family regulator [Tenacibaculum lutimaris]